MSLALFLSHDNWAVIWMTMGILQSCIYNADICDADYLS